MASPTDSSVQVSTELLRLPTSTRTGRTEIQKTQTFKNQGDKLLGERRKKRR